jgi:hypothetical protein
MSGRTFRARIAAGFFQLFQDIGNGRHAELFIGVFDRIERFKQLFVTDDAFNILFDIGQNLVDQRVGFRVHCRRIQRIVARHHAQKAGGLLKRLVAQARHRAQRRAGRKQAFHVAISNNALRDAGV